MSSACVLVENVQEDTTCPCVFVEDVEEDAIIIMILWKTLKEVRI